MISPNDIAHHAGLDANGEYLNIGDLVRIPKIPEWLLQDLPEEEQTRLRALEGMPLRILEFDAYGYAWFGEGSPWFCVRPAELIRDVAASAVPAKSSP